MKHNRIIGGGAEGASVEHLANTFNFSHGRKVPKRLFLEQDIGR